MPTANSRSISKKIIALVLVSFSAVMFEAQAQVTIRGSASCGQWISDGRQNSERALLSERWLVGFLSGMAFHSGKDFIKGTDNPSIFLWVSNYCQANPLKEIVDAGNALFNELVKQKRL